MPTLQTKGVAINDDQGLEGEADVMGAKAASTQSTTLGNSKMSSKSSGDQGLFPITQCVIQRFGTPVEPEDEPALVQHIQAYRNTQNYHERAFARGEHNVAVAYNAAGIWRTDHSHNGRHSEDNLNRQAPIVANRALVTRIHTEREPCEDCEGIITNDYITPGILTENNVTYWGEYQDKEERKVGTQVVKDITETAYEQSFLGKVGGSQSRSGRTRKATAF